MFVLINSILGICLYGGNGSSVRFRSKLLTELALELLRMGVALKDLLPVAERMALLTMRGVVDEDGNPHPLVAMAENARGEQTEVI